MIEISIHFMWMMFNSSIEGNVNFLASSLKLFVATKLKTLKNQKHELTGFEEIAGFESAPQQCCSKNCSSLSLNSALVLDLKSEEGDRLEGKFVADADGGKIVEDSAWSLDHIQSENF